MKRKEPTKPPGGRVRRQRVAERSTGNKGLAGSRIVEHRLGKEPDGSDYNPEFCMARSRNRGGQCSQRPAKGRKTCMMHGGGSPKREARGTATPEERGRVGRAVQLVREKRAKGEAAELISFVEAHMEEFEQRVAGLEAAPDALALGRDAVILTALRDLLLKSEDTGITLGGIVKVIPELIREKTNVLKTKHDLERKDYVHGDRFRQVTAQLIAIIQKFVPEDRHAEVARALALLGARPDTIDTTATDVTPNAEMDG